MRPLETNNEQGYIMVWALLLLIVVTLLGVAGISTSIFEERMAANEALHKQTFYQADGGTEVGLGLLIHNINCISGFSATDLDGNITMNSTSSNFWLTNNQSSGSFPMVSDTNWDFQYPSSDNADNMTRVAINGTTQMVAGASLNELAGYEGKGKGVASDGAFLEFEIKSEHLAARNSWSGICTAHRLDNQFAAYPAGECVY
ncbi:PilX N-terminal domain-containing pilus assembly protein [Thermodesulfobacteriota bacterium]